MDQELKVFREEMKQTRLRVENLETTLRFVAKAVVGLQESLDRQSVILSNQMDEVNLSASQTARALEAYVKEQCAILDRRIAVLESRAAREHRDVFEVICESFNLHPNYGLKTGPHPLAPSPATPPDLPGRGGT
jgi:hypothetical protein